MNAEDIIKALELEPLDVEGGFFKRVYTSRWKIPEGCLPEGYKGERFLGTGILYLITPESYSLLHRLPGDEVFHFYMGDPVTMVQLHPDGSFEVITLGHNILKGEKVQVVVPGGTWQGCFLKEGGRFALMGTTMCPGFDYMDFEKGKREELLKLYPEARELIIKLT